MNGADLTGRTLGGFTILRKLGAGGMATVYKAHEGSLNRVVALKVIHEHLARQPEFVQRFYREARAAAQLSHPNIIQIYAVGEDEGVPYFSMEYVKGTSLQELVEADGFLPARRAVAILAQAAQALAAAHEIGIVHRDIKPSNIMIDAAGRVKVADFGIAHVATEERLTGTGMMVGTPGYTSPEQCLGKTLDARSDIYSLGVTAYEMLTGQTPFHGETPAALILQIVDRDPPPLASLNPTVPVGVQRLVEKMMHKDRAQRFQSAEDVVTALSAIDLQTAAATVPQPVAGADDPTALRSAPAAEGLAATQLAAAAVVAPPPPGPEQGAPPPSRSRLPGLALLLLLALGAAAAVAFASWRLLGGANAEMRVAPAAPAPVANRATADRAIASPVDPTTVDLATANPVTANPVTGDPATADAVTPEGADPGDAAAAVAAAPRAGGRSAAPEPAAAVVAPRAVTGPDDAGARVVPVAAAPASTRRAAGPPGRSVVASTEGDYEHVGLVSAAIESVLLGGGFEIVDFVPEGRQLEDVARFQVVSSVTVVGARELVYYGRVDTLYTVSLTVRATDLATGTRAAGPFATTVDYTAIKLEEKLTQGAEELAEELVRDLDARLAAGR